MTPTNDNHRPIASSPKTENGLKRLLLRSHGHLLSFLQKFFKSGIKKKNDGNIPLINIPAPLTGILKLDGTDLLAIMKLQDELQRKYGRPISITIRMT